MKKLLFVMPFMAMLVMMSICYSCGNGNMKQYSKENIEKDFKVFLSECFNTDYKGLLSCLSDDFNDVIAKCDSAGLEHNIFGLNSSATIQYYSILSISDIKENRVTAQIKLGIDNEGDFYEKEFSVYLILEREQWVVDEIGVVKQELKTALEEGLE